MRPSTDLQKVQDAFSYRLLRIRRVFGLALLQSEPRRSEYIAVSVIELDNLILGSLRAYTISSLRRARTCLGQKISTTRVFGDEEEIGAYMLSVLEVRNFQNLRSPRRVSRRQEPTVRDPRNTAKVLLSCNASNLGSLQNALSLNTSLFNDLSTVRNFYAHRNSDTWRKALVKANAMGIFGVKHPNDLVTAALSGRPVSLFEDWLDDAETFFEEATK